MISTMNLAAMLASGIITILTPIILLIFWCVKKKAKLMPALGGILIFMVFARTLEMIPHMFFIFSGNGISKAITGNPMLYALYGGLMAGIFEETGRLVAFRFLAKNYSGKENAVTYGIGHGGFEAMSVVGFGFIQYFTIARMINDGSMATTLAAASGQELASLKEVVTFISSLTAATCAVNVIDSLCSLILSIALSVILYHSFTTPGKKWLFPIAILLHAGLSIFAGLAQTNALPLFLTEAMAVIYTGFVARWAYLIYTGKTKSAQ